VSLELKSRPDAFDLKVMATAQHRDMLDQVLRVFEIRPDLDLNIMTDGQTLAYVTCSVVTAMDAYLAKNRADVVLVQGDTTTCMAASLACFYRDAAVGHVEAGLRTWNLREPRPEEFNRRVTALTARYHFAPTEHSADNLRREGVEESSIHVIGNTVIDALFHVLHHTAPPPRPVPAGAPYLLMTCHRREVFGEPIREIFTTIRDYARAHRDLYIWYPVHPNPNVKGPATEILGGEANVVLTGPLDYIGFVHAMQGARLVVSDSGGVQEEAPSLGKPVLVLRDRTERPEAAEAGTCLLVGPHRDRIMAALERLLGDEAEYNRMSAISNPFGDGSSSRRIADILQQVHA
jgi:UDP-N-acetylglucosamine 2-epimerase (non-hydrolysing)